MLFLYISAKMFSGVKFVYINLMINSGGMSLTTIMTLGHGELNVITKASDEALLEAIDKIKVIYHYRHFCIIITNCNLAIIERG